MEYERLFAVFIGAAAGYYFACYLMTAKKVA